MAKKQTKTEESLIILENIKASQIVEISKWEKIQKKLIKDNPFITISDTATYNKAKSNRTSLLKGRTSLLGTNGQEGVIRSAFKNILTGSIEILQGLSKITEPHYEKQQAEVKRYEAIIEEKRQEKQRIAEEKRLAEEKRINDINNKIDTIYREEKEKIYNLTYDGIDAIENHWEVDLKGVDAEIFEEFEITYFKTLERLGEMLKEKIDALNKAEEQRLEGLRLAEDRKKFEDEKAKTREAERKEAEKKQKIQDKIDADNRKKAEELKEKEEKLRKEQDRIDKIESDRLEKIRIKKENEEAEKRERENLKRLKKLQPEREKAIEYVNSLQFTTKSDISDKSILEILDHCNKRVSLVIQDTIDKINTL